MDLTETPIDVGIGSTLTLPGHPPRVFLPPDIEPRINGERVGGVQRLTARDVEGERIIELHVNRRFGNSPIARARRDLHVEIILTNPDLDDREIIAAIGVRAEVAHPVDGRDVWRFVGVPADD